MRALLPDLPKSLLPIGDKPILEHQLLWLRSLGFKEAILCLGYKADAIRQYFGDGARWGFHLEYHIEQTPRGTAGAVKDAIQHTEEDMLIVYGDLFLRFEGQSFLQFHRNHSGIATLLVCQTDHPWDSDLITLDAGNRIQAFLERGQKAPSLEKALACAAVWTIRPSLLPLIPENIPSDFARNIFPKALMMGKTLMAYKTEGLVADIGTPERYVAFKKKHEAMESL